LAHLGHDVYYFEDLSQWPYNLDRGQSGDDWIAYDPTLNVTYLSKVMARYGLEERRLLRFMGLTVITHSMRRRHRLLWRNISILERF